MSSTLKWLSRFATCSPQLVPCSAFVKSKGGSIKCWNGASSHAAHRLVASVKAALRTICPTWNFDASSGVRLMSLAKSCNPAASHSLVVRVVVLLSFYFSCLTTVRLIIFRYCTVEVHDARLDRSVRVRLVVWALFRRLTRHWFLLFLANTMTDVPDSET